MCLSQNNNKVFVAIVLGIFLASGCSGHSVKYGANSEGQGMGSDEEMNEVVDGVQNGSVRYSFPFNGCSINFAKWINQLSPK